MDPATYHAWYESHRGAWIAERERRLLVGLLHPHPGETLLDLGCGTGHFSGAFRALGLAVTGLDPDLAALRFFRSRDPAITTVAGAAESLPFADGAFDSAIAVTSLCFVARPEQALAELWRVSRGTVVLGLLHRRSLLYLSRRGRGGYQGARWDLAPEVLGWTRDLTPAPRVEMRWALFPTEQTFMPGDHGWGMIPFGHAPGTRFDLSPVWTEDGAERTARLNSIHCTPDRSISPAETTP